MYFLCISPLMLVTHILKAFPKYVGLNINLLCVMFSSPNVMELGNYIHRQKRLEFGFHGFSYQAAKQWEEQYATDNYLLLMDDTNEITNTFTS